MENKNYHRTIMVKASAEEAMKKISQVDRWWGKEFSGSTKKLNDTFTVPFGEVSGEISFVDFVITELVPNKKVVWKVMNCNLPWFNDKREWNDTEVIFELSSEKNNTKIDFSHIGLVPEVECYDACEKGWDMHITHDLVKFMNEEN
ncbi:MAG TPA: SRPBCC domain-containing protein [Cytophagaceae bacterium]|nr:SRPBCC domain-containing protein [Cytophagaceae bacterium]